MKDNSPKVVGKCDIDGKIMEYDMCSSDLNTNTDRENMTYLGVGTIHEIIVDGVKSSSFKGSHHFWSKKIKRYKYLLVLDNDETREILILPKPVYRVMFRGDASTYYRTKSEIDNDARVEVAYWDQPFYLYEPSVGHCVDEGALFTIYKNLRKPIKELKKIEYYA